MDIITLTKEDGYTRFIGKTEMQNGILGKPVVGDFISCGRRPSDEEKQYYPFVAAVTPGRKFKWFLSAEEWVLRKSMNLVSEYTLPAPLDTTVARREFERLKAEAPGLRPGQIQIVEEALQSVEKGLPYRKGLIAPCGFGKTLVDLILCLVGDAVFFGPKHTHSTIRAEAARVNLPCPPLYTPEGAVKLKGPSPTTVIVDETISMKNPLAGRTMEVTRVAEDSAIVIAQTGTPLSARHDKDLQWINVCGSYLPREWEKMAYNWGVNPHRKDVSALGVTVRTNDRGEPMQPLDVDGWKHDELAAFIAPHVKIFDIKDLMKDVPPVTYQQITIPTPPYFRAILRGLLTQKSTSKRLMQARMATSGFINTDDDQVLMLGKGTPPKVSWCLDLAKSNPGEPLVFFCGFNAEIGILADAFKKAGYNPAVIHNAKSSAEVSRFTSGETDIAVCSAYLGEGMNFQRSRMVTFLSNPTRPDKRTQAELRSYRPGQERPVIIYDLICPKTLDQRARDLLKEHLEESEGFINAQLAEELKKLLGEA